MDFEDFVLLLIAVLIFAFVTLVLSFIADLGIWIAFQVDPNLYGIWILTITISLFCLIFIKND